MTLNHILICIKWHKKAKNYEVIVKSLSEQLLDGQLMINASWPDFNATLILISGVITLCSLLAIIWLIFKVRKLSAAFFILQQCQQARALPSTLPSFIYKQITENTDTQSQYAWDITLDWQHAIFLLYFLILAISITVFLKINRKQHSHVPWLCAEILSIDSCILLPVIRLPLCPSQCHIQVPVTISRLIVCGSWFAPSLKLDWPNLTNRLTGHAIAVPKTFDISPLHAYKLKKVLSKPFFVHLHISHNGFLKQI